MKDKDFQQMVDHEFAQLEWTDQQRMDTLRKMNKEERPVMKRKFSVALVVTLLLLTLTGTAVAATGCRSSFPTSSPTTTTTDTT